MDLRGISYKQVKWQLFGSHRWPGVLYILSKREPCMPVVLLHSTEDSQVLFKSLISSFAGSIGLRVVHCADVLVDV